MGFLEHNSSYFCVLMGSLSTHEKKKPDFLKTNLHELISAKKKPIFVLKHQEKLKMKKVFLLKSLFLCITSTFG